MNQGRLQRMMVHIGEGQLNYLPPRSQNSCMISWDIPFSKALHVNARGPKQQQSFRTGLALIPKLNLATNHLNLQRLVLQICVAWMLLNFLSICFPVILESV